MKPDIIITRIERIQADLNRTIAQMQFALGDSMAVEALFAIKLEIGDLRGLVARALGKQDGV